MHNSTNAQPKWTKTPYIVAVVKQLSDKNETSYIQYNITFQPRPVSPPVTNLL